jgi:hypothetical protein
MHVQYETVPTLLIPQSMCMELTGNSIHVQNDDVGYRVMRRQADWYDLMYTLGMHVISTNLVKLTLEPNI